MYCGALSISASTILLEAVLAVPCRPQFLRFGRCFTHFDCGGTWIGADRGSAAQRALGVGYASGACSLTTTAGCSRCFSGSAEAAVAGASLPRLRRQTWALSDENTDSTRLRRWYVLSNSSGFSYLHLSISALGLWPLRVWSLRGSITGLLPL